METIVFLIILIKELLYFSRSAWAELVFDHFYYFPTITIKAERELMYQVCGWCSSLRPLFAPGCHEIQQAQLKEPVLLFALCCWL